MNYEAIVNTFIETRNADPLRAVYESELRRSFEIYTCHQGGTDEFMEEFFQRLKTLPFPGGHPVNWMWRVFADMAEAVKRMTPATEAALVEALANRDAILALPVPELDSALPPPAERDYFDRWIVASVQVGDWFDSKLIDPKFIDCDLIAKRLVA